MRYFCMSAVAFTFYQNFGIYVFARVATIFQIDCLFRGIRRPLWKIPRTKWKIFSFLNCWNVKFSQNNTGPEASEVIKLYFSIFAVWVPFGWVIARRHFVCLLFVVIVFVRNIWTTQIPKKWISIAECLLRFSVTSMVWKKHEKWPVYS